MKSVKTSQYKRGVLGWLLAGLNFLAALNSTYFFLGQAQVGATGWLMLNTCAPSIALFLLGFLLASPTILVAASVPMFRYGTLGLFAFAWDGYNIIPQIGHILMTLAVLYIAVDVVRRRDWKALGWGLALGFAILIPFMMVQNAWFETHPEMLEKLFSGNIMPVNRP
jgi:hypothetical protein